MSATVTHAQGPDGLDCTLCGLAYEEMAEGMEAEGEQLAEPGAVVTCARCRAVIAYCKTFRRYRQP